jgi:hypothetical protein
VLINYNPCYNVQDNNRFICQWQNVISKNWTAQEGNQLAIGKTSTLSLALARRVPKKKAQKHKRASKSRGQNAAGKAMAAVEPVKSRVDSFGQLV